METQPTAAKPTPPPLATMGELALTFIGSGSAFAKRYYQNNLLVAKGAEHVLIDCGARTPEALDRLGIPIVKINRFLITHTHADHIGGLEEAMLMNRYFAKKRSRMVVAPRLRTILWNQSLRGGSAWNEMHDGKPLSFGDFWIEDRPRRVPGADRELMLVQVGELKLHLFRTKHVPEGAPSWRESFPSYGVIIDGCILFTSDTRFDPDLLEWALANFPLKAILHDVQFFTGGVHAGIDELGTLPAAIKAKMFLMHYGDKLPEMADHIAELGFAGIVEQWKTYRY
jgi:ribonuclease BN (tRNA processing enzyme)